MVIDMDQDHAKHIPAHTNKKAASKQSMLTQAFPALLSPKHENRENNGGRKLGSLQPGSRLNQKPSNQNMRSQKPTKMSSLQPPRIPQSGADSCPSKHSSSDGGDGGPDLSAAFNEHVLKKAPAQKPKKTKRRVKVRGYGAAEDSDQHEENK